MPAGGKKGNKGGGRKPLAKEMSEMFWILDRWNNAKEVKALVEKQLRGEALSLREIYVLKAAQGSERILSNLADKVLPDKLDENALSKLPAMILMDL